MMFIKKLLFFFCFYLVSCSQINPITSGQIIEKSISAYGWNKKNFSITFDFRDYQYKLIRKPLFYSYQRLKVKEGVSILDVMTSKNKLTRLVEGKSIKLNDSVIKLYSNSLNSVMYFFQLPYPLKDSAVVSELLGTTKILGKEYWSIKVTFNEVGGGTDFKDEYRYWIDKNNFQITFFAYNYLTDGGGVRFRKAKNIRDIKGFLFQDYVNYKPKIRSTPLDSLPILFQKDLLQIVSSIENKIIHIEIQ